MKKYNKYSDSLLDLLRKKNVSFLIEKNEEKKDSNKKSKDKDKDEDENEKEEDLNIFDDKESNQNIDDDSSSIEDEENEDEKDEEDKEDEDEEDEPEKKYDDVIDSENEEKFKFQHSLDRALEDVFLDFEKISQIKENKKNKKLSLTLIYENSKKSKSNDLKIDINKFAEETARLIKNYQNLLDMEAIIFNKAKEFLLSKGYDEFSVKKFKELLSNRHSIDFFDEEETQQRPIAVGARGGSSGGL